MKRFQGSSNSFPPAIWHRDASNVCFRGPRLSPQANTHSIQLDDLLIIPKHGRKNIPFYQQRDLCWINAQWKSLGRNTLGVSPFEWEKRPKTVFRGPSWCLACCCFFHRPANRSTRALHTARAPTGCWKKPRPLLYAGFVIGWKYHVKNNTSLIDWNESQSVLKVYFQGPHSTKWERSVS